MYTRLMTPHPQIIEKFVSKPKYKHIRAHTETLRISFKTCWSFLRGDDGPSLSGQKRSSPDEIWP